MKVAIYDTVSGKIKRFIHDTPACIDIQCTQENEDYYLNCPEDSTHIVNNEPIKIISNLELLAQIRYKRNTLLDTADLKYCNAERWENMPKNKRAEWSLYKQALRDFPATCDVQNPIWPDVPK